MKIKKILWFTITTCILGILFIMYMLNSNTSNNLDNKNPIAKSSMIKTTLEWGRLAPFPESKTDFNIHTEGNSFTRAFRTSFYLPRTELDKWIKASPGLGDAKIEAISKDKHKYLIKPGGEAQYAEVIIDSRECFVQIYVYWS